ncbi:MAG: TonB-dependent receptor [Gammaproteobacteria bacterium]
MLKPVRHGAISVAATLILTVLAGPVCAQATHRFDVSSQPLGRALNELATQAGINIYFSPPDVQGKQSPPLKADVSTDDALAQLLAGSQLTFRYLDEQTITIVQAASPSPRDLEEVQVTGSRLQTESAEGAHPVREISRQEIQRSGRTTLQGFLTTLPEVSIFEGQTAIDSVNGQYTPRVRGLPGGSTLVLLNGRPLQTGGASRNGSFDLSLIPVSAIERIDVLGAGSSAIYGSDGLAGVINVILRDHIRAPEIDVRYSSADGLDQEMASIAAGSTFSRGAVSVIGSFMRSGSLMGTERDITANMDYRGVGGPDLRSTTCAPGNVYSTSTAPLPGLTATRTAVPETASGRPSIADFAGGAGAANLCNHYSGYALVPAYDRANLFLSGTFSITSSLSAFSELLVSRNEQTALGVPVALSRVKVPASNAFNPFGTDVLVDYHIPGVRGGSEFNSTLVRPVVGLKGDSWGDTHWEVSATWSRDRDTRSNYNSVTNTANLNAALASSNPSTALNPFDAGAGASADVLASIYSTRPYWFEGTKTLVSGQLRGGFSLFGSRAAWIVGAEHAKDSGENSDLQLTADRTNDSLFGEVRLPLLTRQTTTGGSLDTLAVSAAVRRDAYDDLPTKTSPEFGLEWRPLDTLLVRGTTASAYRAPPLLTQFSGLANFTTQVRDPRRNELVTVNVVQGGNVDIRPETGQSSTVGLVWSPRLVVPTKVSLTGWKIDLTDRVVLLGTQDIVNAEDLFPDRVIRNPSTGGTPGAITTLDRRYTNFGKIVTSGVDLDTSATFHALSGELTPSVVTTYVRSYDLQLTPGVATTHQVSRASSIAWAPRWKGTAALAWSRGETSARVAARYVSRYLDYQLSQANNNYLGNVWYGDVFIDHDFGSPVAGVGRMKVSLGVVNVTNELPRYSAYSSIIAYDPSTDPVGRQAFLGLNVAW